jgi:sec-independent protein translocase protein TatB
MEFLGVGPLELLFIFLIALIVLGPKDIVKAGRTMGRFLNKVVTSPTWRAIKQTSREMRTLPTKLMHEAGIEEEIKGFQDINRDVQELKKISSSISIKEVEEDIKEPLEEQSTRTKPSVDKPASHTSPGASERLFPSDDKSNNSHLSDNSQES